MTNKINPRQTAFQVLLKVFKENAYTNLALDTVLQNSGLLNRDKSLATAIVYGTIERKITLDFVLEKYLSQPIEKLKTPVLIILRLSAYQLLFMDKIPDSAVINEGVNLAKSNGCGFSAGLVNAVLRKISVSDFCLEKIGNLSIKYSCPSHLINMWKKMYGEENTIGILENINGNVPVTIRVNTLKTSVDDLKLSLEKSGVCVIKNDLCEDALIIENTNSISELEEFRNGLFHVQDLASQLCAEALCAKEGEVVLDVCASPGGKSFTIAEIMGDTGKIHSFDIYEQRLSLIKNDAERLGITSISTAVNDASKFSAEVPFVDKILCDVVCSGLGIIRKKPEIRYKELDSIKHLPEIQLQILETSSKYLKVGGTLVYSTCSLNKKENEKVVDLFLEKNKDFVAVPVLPCIEHIESDNHYLTLFPHIHGTDGFFIAKLERIG